MRTIAGILCAHYDQGFVAKGIAWLTQSPGEPKTWFVHTGDWFRFEDDRGAASEDAIESLFSGTAHVDPHAKYTRPGSWAIVAVPVGIPEHKHRAVRAHAEHYLGKRYDFLSIARHAGDGLLGRLVGGEVRLFRRIRLPWNREHRYNICAWLDAWTWWLGAGWKFTARVRTRKGPAIVAPREIAPEDLAPDHIADDIFSVRPSAYQIVAEYGQRPKDLPVWMALRIDDDLAHPRDVFAPATT